MEPTSRFFAWTGQVGLMNLGGRPGPALMSVMTANLVEARALVSAAKAACSVLIGALTGGQLSGAAYDSAKALFEEVFGPAFELAEESLDDFESDLEAYKRADSLVNRYGNLNEDDLRRQLYWVTAQRDLTEVLIETNRNLALSLASLPGVSAALSAATARLELVVTQLEADIWEIEDKLKALETFDAQTRGLFACPQDRVIGFVGGHLGVIDAAASIAGGGVDVWRINRFRGGLSYYKDAEGRVRYRNRWGAEGKLYDRFGSELSPGGKPNHLYRAGRIFNEVTGQRIDTYRQPFKAGGIGFKNAVADTVRDFDWRGCSRLAKAGKALGIVGTGVTVAQNWDKYFADGVQGNDVRDFAVDTAVDIGAGATAAGIGAAFGSMVLPPLGTVVGAGAGLFASVVLNWDTGDGESLVDKAKNWVRSWFQ